MDQFVIVCNKLNNALLKPIDLREYLVSVVDFFVSTDTIDSSTSYKLIIHDTNNPKNITIILARFQERTTFGIVRALTHSLESYADINLNADGLLNIEVTIGKTIIIPNSLAQMLGFTTTILGEGQTVANINISPHIFYNRLLMASNLIEPYQIHNRYLPVVYLGPVSYHTNKGMSHNTLNKEIDCIQLQFFNVACETIDLPDGTFTVTFCFRKMLKR